MMRGRIALVAMTAALVAAGAVTADAGAVKVQGTVVFDQASELSTPIGPGRDSAVYGRVFSKQACLGNRKVVIEATYDTESGFRPYDVARSGTNGAFSGIGALTHNGHGLDGVKLTMKPKEIGTRRHPKTCKGDTVKVVE